MNPIQAINFKPSHIHTTNQLRFFGEFLSVQRGSNAFNIQTTYAGSFGGQHPLGVNQVFDRGY